MPSVEGVHGCITGESYVLDYLAVQYPDTRLEMFLVSAEGTACFCDTYLCNTNIIEPEESKCNLDVACSIRVFLTQRTRKHVHACTPTRKHMHRAV